MKKYLLLILIAICSVNLLGCDEETDEGKNKSFLNGEYEVDYMDAASFEYALNDGKKVKGKIVQFDVNEYKPNSALGINCWSGEHLNFISETELDVEAGDIIVGYITKEPSKVLGSWKIPYEVIEINPGNRTEEIATEEPTPEEKATAEEEITTEEESTRVDEITTEEETTIEKETTIDEESTTEDETTEENNENYKVGDEVVLGGIYFNIYKIDNYSNELYLLAKENIAFTTFSDSNRSHNETNVYKGSLVEEYVNEFVDHFEDMGYIINSSGIIDVDELYELGFKDSITVSGRPYLCDNVYEFVKYEKNYWIDGYYRVSTYKWVYYDEKIDTKSCSEEFGVRPVITIDKSEINRVISEKDSYLTIKEIVDSDCAWMSEGGIANPYDRYYFDCENMIFKNVFESSVLTETNEFSMKFVDDKTIYVDGIRSRSEFPAEITIVNNNKLRIRFLDDAYNDGDYYLNKVIE